MTSAAKPTVMLAKRFENQYRSSPRSYAKSGGEQELQKAYELGQQAIEAEEVLPDLASIQHEVLSDLLAESGGNGTSAQLVRAGSQFLAESLSHYEDRVVQEAPTDITKDAKARRVTSHIRFEAGMLLCSVEDDGAGFDMHTSHRKKRSRFDWYARALARCRGHVVDRFFAAWGHKIADPSSQQ